MKPEGTGGKCHRKSENVTKSPEMLGNVGMLQKMTRKVMSRQASIKDTKDQEKSP